MSSEKILTNVNPGRKNKKEMGITSQVLTFVRKMFKGKDLPMGLYSCSVYRRPVFTPHFCPHTQEEDCNHKGSITQSILLTLFYSVYYSIFHIVL